MHSQLVHLVLLCIVLSLTASHFAGANDGEIADERNREFKRLFGETSEPLEPEEAKRLLAHQWTVYAAEGAPTDPVERAEFQAQVWLLEILVRHFEAFSANCKGKGFWVVDEVASHIDKLPALKGYFDDRRGKRLLESCNRLIVRNLQEYKHLVARFRNKVVAIESTLESLAQVPAQMILGENWIKEKNDQVSAALYAIMQKNRPSFKWFGSSSGSSDKDLRKLLDSTLLEPVCQRLPTLPKIIPAHLAIYFMREGKLDQLNSAALNWQKLDRICELIRIYPDIASDILSSYKDKQKRRKSQAE